MAEPAKPAHPKASSVRRVSIEVTPPHISRVAGASVAIEAFFPRFPARGNPIRPCPAGSPKIYAGKYQD